MSESILLHACCAHCTAYPVEYWRQQGYEVTAFWYNPNIHPFTEHQNRFEAMKKLSQEMKFPLIVVDGYDMPAYFRAVAGNEEDRCRYCFRLRLSKAAQVAKENSIANFTTTLLISPHQKHELINEVGDRIAAESGVAFLYADLRKRYSDSRHITKPMDLYRQQYCGCLYSEWERYQQ
ncbi:MAG: epoxyqueuosine reductase QueH [Dehalococcoidales bacterium]|nr:epoxyqueuosine reductase QueH [Dehalococcoidales bacterium]